MTPRSGTNRAIAIGDQARAGVGEGHAGGTTIQRIIAGWSTGFLKRFIPTCKSDVWRKEAHSLLLQREGVTEQLQNLNSKKARRKRRGSKKAQLY